MKSSYLGRWMKESMDGIAPIYLSEFDKIYKVRILGALLKDYSNLKR